MKKDKEWLKKNLERVLYNAELSGLFSTGITSSVNIVYYDVLTLIDQLDEPEQVVVPQFVAEWIEYCKKHGESISGCLALFNPDYDKAFDWINANRFFNENTIARAWIDGYTIEQPKILTITVKDCDKTIATKKVPEDEANKMMREW